MKFAPSGVLRAAAWPLNYLEEFGDKHLAELAVASPADCAHQAAFKQAYKETLERERHYLWRCVHEDAWFSKALALSSPSAYARIQSARARLSQPRNRAMRLAEYALYRYLARATGRSTPHGLWAGVTDVKFGEECRIESIPAQTVFAPDLRPFQSVLRHVASDAGFRELADWKLNPTLNSRPLGGWVFLHRRPDGCIEKRNLDHDNDVASILSALAELAPQRLDQLVADVALRTGWPTTRVAEIRELLNTLVTGGVIIGGIDLPSRFSTPWEALETVSPQLQGDLGRVWVNTVRLLRDRCDHLSSAIWTMSNEDFVSQLNASRGCILCLCQSVGLPEDVVPVQVLRCDLRLPWRITLDKAQYAHLMTTLDDYDQQWLRSASPDSANRENLRSRIAIRLAGGRSLIEGAEMLAQESRVSPPVWPHWCEVEEPQVRERLRRWEACLNSSGSDVSVASAIDVADHAVAPAGCFFVGLSGDFALAVSSVADIPTLASSRFGSSIDMQGITNWICSELAKSVAESGISFAELRVPFEVNPNVLAGRDLLPDCVEPWSATARSLSLLGAAFALHDKSGRPVLRLAGSDRCWAVMAAGIANTQALDPLVHLLLLTGFHESPGRNQRAVDVPLASELAERKFTPRVLLQHGAVLRQPRSLLSKEIPALVKARASDRFRLWQHIAVDMQWPEQLYVAADGGEPMRMHRDSPLALEALFKGLGKNTAYLAVEAAAPAQGLEIPGQGRHVCELAVPFSRHS